MLIYLTVNLRYICFIYKYIYLHFKKIVPVIGVAGRLSLFFLFSFHTENVQRL